MLISIRRSFLFLLTAMLFASPALSESLRVEGSLQNGDDKLDGDGEFYDTFEIKMKAGQVLDVKMVSEDVDCYIAVLTPDDDQIESDDGPDGSTDTNLVHVATVTGTYEIIATTASIGESGAYKLSAAAYDSKPLKQETGTLAKGDEVNWKGGEYLDRIQIELKKGEKQMISLESDDFDGYLSVHTPDGDVLLADDPATLIVQASDAGAYTVVVTSFGPREVGDYVVKFRSIEE